MYSNNSNNFTVQICDLWVYSCYHFDMEIQKGTKKNAIEKCRPTKLLIDKKQIGF